MDDLILITTRLQVFEQKYGLLSSDFYVLYSSNEFDSRENLRDVLFQFLCRGAAFESSPAFQRRELYNLDPPVAERRLSGGFQ